MQSNSLSSFIVKIFLWLPLCYCIWYLSAPYSVSITNYLTEWLLKSYFADLVLGIEQTGYNLEVIVKATMPQQDIPKGMVAELPYPINPLIYNYGMPLCLALILSSPNSPKKLIKSIAICLVLLLLVQIWGIYFDFLKSVFLQTPSHLIGHTVLQQWQLEMIGISYQIGALVLPPVTPLVIWLFLYKQFIIQFIPAFAEAEFRNHKL